MAKEKPVNPHEPILSTEVHWRTPTRQDLVLNDEGRELLSPLPLSPPVGYVKTKTLAEQMREMIRSEALKQAAIAAGAETFEEADDFDIGDDYDPSSPWEWEEEPELLPGSPSPLPPQQEPPANPSGGSETPPQAAQPLTAAPNTQSPSGAPGAPLAAPK